MRNPEWDEANLSGIWLSVGSEQNSIVGNTFEDIASAAVGVEGDSNHVELRSPSDKVLDLGIGNRIQPEDEEAKVRAVPGRERTLSSHPSGPPEDHLW